MFLKSISYLGILDMNKVRMKVEGICHPANAGF